MAVVEDNRVFVGGLPWSVSEEDLRETFSKYGEVVDARVNIRVPFVLG
jgi:RNA recognition motif-containing protein